MRGRFFSGLAAGALLGAAAGMMMMPQMNYRTRRRMKRAGKRLGHMTQDLMDNMREYRR